jgi:hypothetical protein
VGLALEAPGAAGTLLGFLLGASLTGFGLAWQAHWLRLRPARAWRAQLEAFLAKLVLLTAFALVFRYVDVVGARVDWRAFVVAFAAAVALLLPLGTYENTTLASRRVAARPTPTRSAP